jgi:hypothetical protein
MSLIFVDGCECKNCIHNKVCNLKDVKKEIVDKIFGHADNIASTDSFKLSLSCAEYEGGIY